MMLANPFVRGVGFWGVWVGACVCEDGREVERGCVFLGCCGGA